MNYGITDAYTGTGGDVPVVKKGDGMVFKAITKQNRIKGTSLTNRVNTGKGNGFTVLFCY